MGPLLRSFTSAATAVLRSSSSLLRSFSSFRVLFVSMRLALCGACLPRAFLRRLGCCCCCSPPPGERGVRLREREEAAAAPLGPEAPSRRPW